jgi:hypothetical protein
MMLNILAQLRVGTLRVRIKDQRRILNMLEKSRKELLKLDPAKLGEEYARIVGKKPNPQSTIDQQVEELLMKLKDDVAKEEKTRRARMARKQPNPPPPPRELRPPPPPPPPAPPPPNPHPQRTRSKP